MGKVTRGSVGAERARASGAPTDARLRAVVFPCSGAISSTPVPRPRYALVRVTIVTRRSKTSRRRLASSRWTRGGPERDFGPSR